MIKYEFGNNPEKIKKYLAFWNRDEVKKPLIGFSYKSWFPLTEFKASAAWQEKKYLVPEMIKPEDFMEDQVRLLREGEEIEDDIIRGASPSQAVPWLCGILGNKLRIVPSSVIAEERTLSWNELKDLTLDCKNPWFTKYIDFAKTLVRTADGRFPISHGSELGPSDLASMVRGHMQHIMDYMIEPENTNELLWEMAYIFKEITEVVWGNIPLFHGGYFDAQYSLWAPGPIIRMQEDATAVLSPEIYKKFIQHVDRYLAQQFESAFMHLHSTSMFLLDEILEVEEIKCFEVNIDFVEGGPSISKMITYFKKFQEANRSLLIRGSFAKEELQLLLNSLNPKGIYLNIMVKDREEYKVLKHLTDR